MLQSSIHKIKGLANKTGIDRLGVTSNCYTIMCFRDDAQKCPKALNVYIILQFYK